MIEKMVDLENGLVLYAIFNPTINFKLEYVVVYKEQYFKSHKLLIHKRFLFPITC